MALGVRRRTSTAWAADPFSLSPAVLEKSGYSTAAAARAAAQRNTIVVPPASSLPCRVLIPASCVVRDCPTDPTPVRPRATGSRRPTTWRAGRAPPLPSRTVGVGDVVGERRTRASPSHGRPPHSWKGGVRPNRLDGVASSYRPLADIGVSRAQSRVALEWSPIMRPRVVSAASRLKRHLVALHGKQLSPRRS